MSTNDDDSHGRYKRRPNDAAPDRSRSNDGGHGARAQHDALSPLSWLDGLGPPRAQRDESAGPSSSSSSPLYSLDPTADPVGGAPGKAPQADDGAGYGAVQAMGDLAGPDVQATASQGVATAASPLPHLDRIQASFGSHDVSHVRAQLGGPATDAAGAIGASAYATGHRVAFADSSPSLHTAAHEAAHVVQQRSGVSLKGGVGQAGDPYEQHADAVADRVVAGDSASDLLDAGVASHGGARSAVQMYGSKEHKQTGDVATEGAEYTKAGLSLTHGDLIALRADYFSEKELNTLWETPSTEPGQMVGTQDEIRYAMKDAGIAKGTFQKMISFAPAVKAAVEKRYFDRAQKNTDHFVNPKGDPSGASEGGAHDHYRGAHEKALWEAYVEGTRGGPIQEALIFEGMGHHYLTDSFAAGHLTTPRGAISEHWSSIYPNFGEQFKNKISRELVAKIDEQATLLSDAIPASVIKGSVDAILEGKLRSMALPTMGDIVSLVAHDKDNETGVWVTNDLGWQWKSFGDGKLDLSSGPLRQTTVITAAIKAGISDVQNAYALGQATAKQPLEAPHIYSRVREMTTGPALPGPRYAPEQFLPRLDPAKQQRPIQFQANSIRELWNLPLRDDAPGETYGSLIMASLGEEGGELRAQLLSIHKGLDEEISPISIPASMALINPAYGPFVRGKMYPRKAFLTGVIEPLSSPDTALPYLEDMVNRR